MSVALPQAGAIDLLVGGYARAGSPGLCGYRYLPTDDRWVLTGSDPAIANASFGTVSSRGVRYFVDEEAATVGAYRSRTGGLDRAGSLPSGGGQPCYLSLDASETWLACANYGGGSLALFRLDAGNLAERSFLHADRGGSLDRERQDAPHVHCAAFSPDGRWLHAVDLGTDRIMSLPFDSEKGITGAPIVGWAALPGCGPRHLLFHPRLPVAYLIGELASTLTVLECNPDGTFLARDVTSTLPGGGVGGGNLGGHIVLNEAGDRLYVTNRGHDSIATFAVASDGQLQCLCHVESGGNSPRFLLLLEEEGLALVANEEGGSLVAFAIGESGLIRAGAGAAPMPGAAFICRAPA
jgi:6-phosphogluconolactonase